MPTSSISTPPGPRPSTQLDSPSASKTVRSKLLLGLKDELGVEGRLLPLREDAGATDVLEKGFGRGEDEAGGDVASGGYELL